MSMLILEILLLRLVDEIVNCQIIFSLSYYPFQVTIGGLLSEFDKRGAE